MMKAWVPWWVIPLVVGFATVTVWLRLQIVDTTYAINKTEATIRTLEQERKRSELKLSSLRSPKRLEALAKSRFNLNQPNPDQVVHIK
jgi:cell division protein FtsL